MKAREKKTIAFLNYHSIILYKLLYWIYLILYILYGAIQSMRNTDHNVKNKSYT